MSALLVAAVVLAGAPVDSRATHLAGLARVWGYVKYVHPAMATSDLDWDAALIRALPAVENASSEEAYRTAISALLAELHDPATRVIEKEAAAVVSGRASGALAPRLEAIDSRTAIVVIPNDPGIESIPHLQSEVCARFDDATRFDRVILDLRSVTGERPGWSLESSIVRCFGRLLGQDITPAPARFLTHGFYMMQSVSGGPGGGLGPWASGLTVASAGSLRAEGKRTPRLAFIVNRGTSDLYSLLMALQGQGLAQVVQEGELPAAGLMVTTLVVDEGLTVAVRHGERVRRDGGAGFVADAVLPAGSADAALQKAVVLLNASRRSVAEPCTARTPYVAGAFVERDYSETPYPDRPHRLLALFRLYNVIEYFYPYKELMDRPWRDTLAEFTSRMADAEDATEYALTVSELAVRIQDSHVTLASPVLDTYFGTHRPAVRVDQVEGMTVITEVASDLAEAGLRVGNVVLSVDGEGASARRGRLARYLPASTPGRLDNKIDGQFLLGPQSQPALIEVRGRDGALRRVSAARTLEGLAPRSRPRTGQVYTVLASGFGYVDLQRLEAKQVGAAFAAIRNTPGAIFDMRGYPASGAFSAVVSYLARPDSPPGVIGGSVRYDGHSGSFSLEESLSTLAVSEAAARYAGRVVVLADGSSQSAAEHICALIKSTAAPTFVGSRTSGANGGVTRTILPGGIVVNFTGQSVRHRDGSQLQRVGIVPDIEALPTLAGIRAGRDDVLERAIEFLSRAK
jgi:C-terminal processing protease CtpA/Prc